MTIWMGLPGKPYFNPRSPCGERRLLGIVEVNDCYFNPRSPCGERPGLLLPSIQRMGISIHAPLAGSDRSFRTSYDLVDYFNPRSPCGERPYLLLFISSGETFQSTLPLRGATRQPCRPSRQPRYFNPRSPCGERPGQARSPAG